jgi:(R,R)-butanediol dehydrogenase/meso-butanediol dehydrogenase/diacetyl reductase
MIEPAAVAFYALLRGEVKPGDTVLIAGLGPIGALTVLAAAAAGASRIYVSEPNENKRRFVDEFNVTAGSYHPASSSVAEILMEEVNEVVEQGFEKLTAKTNNALKVLVCSD